MDIVRERVGRRRGIEKDRGKRERETESESEGVRKGKGMRDTYLY